jgi:CHAT domain-containing protein
VLKALTDPSVDVLHYCGHAAFEHVGEDGSGLVCDDGALTARDLRDVQIGPRIVFFNACQSARVRNQEASTQDVSRAFAEVVLSRGVDAYLGTFWPVADAAAALFASAVYLELAQGAELHRAVTMARNQLLKACKPDWANYLLFGTGAFKLKTG